MGQDILCQGKACRASYESTDAKMKKLFTDPLLVAYENYLKAIKLDDKGSIEKLVTLQVGQLGNDFLVWAGEEFDAENYDKSLAAFETLIDLQQKDFYISTLDTVLLFNAGIVSINAKQYDKAINYFNRCIEMGHGEAAPYEYLNSIYITLGDNENAERVLVEAFEKYPEAQNVLLSLIQFYLVNEMDQEAFSYIQKAMAADPGNYRLFWAEGVLYMKQDKLEEATVALGKSIEIEPDFFDTQYNMGVCYYNMGVNMFDKANEIMDNAKYNAAVEEAKKVFAKAIPYMERALELKDDDLDTMKSLKELYYRLQMTDKYNAIVSRIEEIEG
ncbi:MAG: tetratricopeptide repeat protein [Bacteroidales bacterium]